MALDVSTLVSYVKEDENMLLTKSMFTGRTAQIIMDEGTVMTGVKFAEKLNILGTDAIFQDGSGCTRTPSGTTTITQRQVTVGAVAVVEDICVKTLNRTYMSKKLAAGSRVNKLPFEKEYADLKASTIAEQLEIAFWLGDTASANENLNKFDGFVKIIDAANVGNPTYNTNTAALISGGPIGIGTGITDANVKAVVRSVWRALPTRVAGKEDVRIFCGWDVFNAFIASYTDLNLFSFKPNGNEVKAMDGEIVIPGTYYKLTAVHGLDGTNRLFGMRTSNMYMGTDLENEEEKWELMPDQFNNYLRFQVEFKDGVQVAFPNEIVTFKLV